MLLFYHAATDTSISNVGKLYQICTIKGRGGLALEAEVGLLAELHRRESTIGAKGGTEVG